MRLHRLEITAFGPFGATQRIDFDALSSAGLFLLHGPTGAGKTSVLDAVCYALYGGVPGARQGSGGGLRSDHAAPDTPTEVVLDLTVAGRRLEVTRRPEQLRPKRRGTGSTRERAYSALREHRDGAWHGLSRSHQEIGDEIGGLLGMSREQFCQVVLLPQGDFARFLRAEDTARAKLLGRLFDTGRFAAVEERLAQLRRAAETRVRAGDERLLALGHRMGQAADDPALPTAGAVAGVPAQRGAARPLAPGDPGLAEAVLEWAALARSTARERRDIAAAALLAAEERHGDAARRAADAAERARLQGQYATARRRSVELAASAAEYDALRARLERARAAAGVAPALELHAEAERAHAAAAGAERAARARLPREHHEAGAEQLLSLERAHREELGSLTAARRAEARAAAVTAEITALDRQARADEHALDEDAAWLAAWPALRDDRRARVAAAQEAAARAEQLATRAESAQERLSAARRRDELAREADAASAELARARDEAAGAREHWLDTKERRLRGIAAELAAALRAGESCAVCGSTEHPAPARADAGQVDRAAEEAAEAAYQRADAAREAADRRHRPLREALAAAAAAAGDVPTAELASSADELHRSVALAREAAADLPAALAALEEAEREHERRGADLQATRLRAAARASRHENLEREQESLREELERARDGAESVGHRAALLEERAGLLAAAARAAGAAADAAARLKEADARLADAAYRAGFATPALAADALLDEPSQQALETRLEARRQEEAAVAAGLADPAAASAAELPPADPESARSAADAATLRLRAASDRDAEARRRCDALDRLSSEAAADARRLAPLRAEYHRVAALASLAAGTSVHNERKMRLESYVLAARLEQVAAAATVRLHRMSGGRYTLVHSDARSAGGGRSGLGLHVVDAWTGRERDTATLSGGETFFASLALALGLADVVTDEAGGTRLDTLFIDEGFGSLDEQTLDEVLDVLDSLRERDRTVGIVSHVPDLRRRIPVQLRVVKDRSGSSVRQRTASVSPD
ncbi:SMC family ATPase [Streptomyces sp. AV19]|uniref:AAA family ATPase n=1 Tax=Streptomyces sp. AV19 TaxID=2793068 RepID=UPI0018FE85A5|nr:SMC family ATPase [Streptomyces sp. AV19]MBH1938047.1 SMC family ATPase [Streptomyces sp. AV19]MDG4536662.1 SMC family ATPase [Streptomyces sp. AV19]